MPRSAAPAAPVSLLIVSEWTAWRLFPGLRTRTIPYVIGVAPRMRVAAGPLKRLVAWATRRGWVAEAAAIDPAMPWIEGWPGLGYYNDVHHTIEPRLLERFRVADDDPLVTFYAYAIRKAVTDQTSTMIWSFLVLEWLERTRGSGSYRLVGAPALLGFVYRHYLRRDPPFSTARPGQKLVAFGNLLVTLTGALAWLAWRTRLAAPSEPFLVALDGVSPIEAEVVARAVPDRSKALVIWRNAERRDRYAGLVAGCRTAMPGSARITPGDFIFLSVRLVRDVARLWRQCHAWESGLFALITTLPAKRAMFRALFTRFPIRHYWCRDDYSVEHAVRSAELRGMGTRILGMAHGLPINTWIHMWREIDCDVYYTFGDHLHQHCYADSWPATMQVVPTANVHMTPERRSRLALPRGRDILFFPLVSAGLPATLVEVMAVARALPDRRIKIKMKLGRDAFAQAQLQAALADAPPNVDVLDPARDPYELMMDDRYVLTNGSTMSIEAVQFGCMTFVFDLDPSLRDFYYRNFSGLCVSDAADVVRRIQALENGEDVYPFATIRTEAGLSDRDMYDLLRQELSRDEPGRGK